MTWKVRLPLGERRGLEHKGTGSPSSSRQDWGGQRTQDPQEAQDPDIPVLFPPLLPETPGGLLWGGAAARGCPKRRHALWW